VHKYDADLLVGHDLYGDALEVLLNKLSKHDVTIWHRLGRIASPFRLPNSRGTSFHGGNTFRARLLTKGRLLVDTYTAARELLRDTDYDMQTMAQRHLRCNEYQKIPRENVESFFDNPGALARLLAHT
jgi:DNA polymerase elongation subunit (family B)